MPPFYKYGREKTIELVKHEILVKEQKHKQQDAAVSHAETGKFVDLLRPLCRLIS